MENTGDTTFSNAPGPSTPKFTPIQEPKIIDRITTPLTNEQGDERPPQKQASGPNKDDAEWNYNAHGTVLQFPPPMRAIITDKYLRTYLQTHLGTHIITSHGTEICIETVLPHHLPRFQARLWKDLPRQQILDSATENDVPPTQDVIEAAPFIRKIARFLGKNHVFIKNSKKTTLPCSLPCCPKVREANGNPPNDGQLLLEPFVDMLAVRVLTEGDPKEAKYLVFKRCLHAYMSGYWPNIKKKINYEKSHLKFCPCCLDYLWERRVMAWAVPRSKETGHQASGQNQAAGPF